MFEALSIAATGLVNQQRRLDTIADNVANANTNGFKASRLEFKDALYTAGIVPAYPRTPEGNQQQGHGVMISTIVRNFSTGNLTVTNNEMDFAIEGEGFFAIENADGDTVYSKNGNFYTSEGAGGQYLVNSNGNFILDENGQRIRVPEGTESVHMELDGTMRFVADGAETSVKLGIYTFRNLSGLASVGGGCYTETETSGERMPADDIKVHQGMLEGSNVDLGTEMTRLVRAQRAFSLASRALTTADEMEGIANNLRR